MALVSPGIQISVNDQSQYVNANVGSVPLVVLATAQDKTYNNAIAAGTTKANAGKLLSFTSQRDLVTAMGTPTFQLSSAGTPINAGELNEYGLLTAYSALGLGNRLFAIRADINLNELQGTSVRPTGAEADGTYWLDIGSTEFGLYGFNSNTSNFAHISPMLITDQTQVTNQTVGSTVVPTPKSEVGAVGSYALVFTDENGATPTVVRLFQKASSLSYGELANTWVRVGSADWQNSVPAKQGIVPLSSNTLHAGTTSTCYINTVEVQIGTTASPQDFVDAINGAGIQGVKAGLSSTGLLTFFITSDAIGGTNGGNPDGRVSFVDGTNTPLYKSGIVSTQPAGTAIAYCPILFYGSYAQQPTGGWSSTDDKPRPTGSIWWKTSATGGGYAPVLKKYSLSLDAWTSVTAPMYTFARNAIYALDPAGGGINITQNQVISLNGLSTVSGNELRFQIQADALATIATGAQPTGFSSNQTAIINYSVPGADTWPYVNFESSGNTAASFVADILALNIPYVTAQLNSNGTITLTHTAGGTIQITDTDDAFTNAGFVANHSQYIVNVPNLAGVNVIAITNFITLTNHIKYSTFTPYATPTDGTHWYYSNAADIDVMINNGGTAGWKGYKQVSSDARGYDLTTTDANGVIISASTPASQSTGDQLVAGDLWLDSSDLVNFPKLSRYNGTAWVSIDNTDHVSNNGIIFADARWDLDGTTDIVSDALPSTVSMLTSDYLDLDAPDYHLYPRGTLLFNTRRSGYNVKKFVSNYFNSLNFPNAQLPNVTDTWMTVSGLKEDGSMYAGTGAQRALIVAAMKSAVDSNTDLLDANYQFNLLVAPGYPELIPNLVTLNDNRTSTGFVIGDTPMTLAPNATDLTAWNTNANGNGLATASPYLAVYYPAGLTNDLAGNTVAVPASHAVLRTFLYNDNVSYQWFAPAGVHRGLVNNLSDIGYVNPQTGAFVHNGVNHGLRDTLYTMNINPITQLPGTGLVVWGQETRSGDSTARNRVNVVRLENYLRTIFNTIANSFLFEPNDTITRKTLASQIESACHDLLSKRGLYDFLVICDTSNNTPSIIANNQLYVDVAIEPMKDVEFIYIPVALYNPGTVANLGATST